MTVYASPAVIAAVAALLCPVNGKTPREINIQMPFTGRGTVYNALALLVRSGVACFDGEICARRYRRARAA